MGCDKSVDEIILSFFESAKDEVYVRIKLRDTLLAIYTTAAAATFTVAKASSTAGRIPAESLLILPYVCFAFTLLICYHHLCIATLGSYIKFELHKNLSVGKQIHVFDSWSGFQKHRSGAQRLRTLGQALVLLTPPAIALWSNKGAAFLVTADTAFFWLGVCATLASLAVVTTTHLQQRKLKGRRRSDQHALGPFQQRRRDDRNC
jgi:heme exporter protein D